MTVVIRMLGILGKMEKQTQPVIGYFKVFTTEDAALADLAAHRGPRGTLRGPTIAQWVYPFTRLSRESAHLAARTKAETVIARLNGAAYADESEIDEIPGAHAIRVVGCIN